VQRFEKRDQGSRFRRTQILSVSRHVAASLDHLSDQLVLRKPQGNVVKRRASLSAEFAE
jgi:hypothetical protein